MVPTLHNVELYGISVVTGKGRLEFYLQPVLDREWEDRFRLASRQLEEQGELPDLIVSSDDSGYVVSWSDGPQDADVATREIVRLLAQANGIW